jgi:hypothetical protein
VVKTCISFCVMDFLFGKVFLLFKDIRGDFWFNFSYAQFYTNKHNFQSDR